MKRLALILMVAALLALGSQAFAERCAIDNVPAATLLLPYFEVDLAGSGLTTIFSVVNSSQDDVTIEIDVFTNWGVQVLTSRTELAADGVATVNLADWLVRGNLPDKQLDAAGLEHVQAALSGERSPK